MPARRSIERSPFVIASHFNDCISTGDAEQLAMLISEDHVFIDSAGTQTAGKAAVLEAWRGFFASFPDYRNEFTRFAEQESEVVIEGRSICSDSRLRGPALWRAVTRNGLLAEWRVFDDTPENRRALGILRPPPDPTPRPVR